MMRSVLKIALATAALGSFAMASPAAAATVVGNIPVAGSSNGCDTTAPAPSVPDTTPTATSCVGYFAGNVLNNGASSISGYVNNQDVINAAVTALGGTFSGNISNYTGGTIVGDINTFLGFPTGFTGVQIIGIHWGQGSANGGGDPTVGNVTAFYKIDFGSTPQLLTLNLKGVSNAYLFTATAVPEPATWAMMLLGFGGIGFAMRRSRKQAGALMQVA